MNVQNGNSAQILEYNKKSGNCIVSSKERALKYFNEKDISRSAFLRTSYKDLVKDPKLDFNKITSNIFNKNIDKDNKLIILINKTLEDFEKLCKKNNLPFRVKEDSQETKRQSYLNNSPIGKIHDSDLYDVYRNNLGCGLISFMKDLGIKATKAELPQPLKTRISKYNNENPKYPIDINLIKSKIDFSKPHTITDVFGLDCRGNVNIFKKKMRELARNTYKGDKVCAVCKNTQNVQLHHIIPIINFIGPDATIYAKKLINDTINSKYNLIPLCAEHHQELENCFANNKVKVPKDAVKDILNNLKDDEKLFIKNLNTYDQQIYIFTKYFVKNKGQI